MKKAAILLIATTIGACAQNQATKVPLSTDEEKAAYAIGYQTSTLLQKGVKEQELDLYLDQFFSGMRTGVEGNKENLLMTETEIEEYTEYHKNRITEKQESERAALAAKNLEESSIFLTQNASQEGVTVLESGLQYEKISSSGNKKHPSSNDTVVVHYHGTLIDGTVFDSSMDRGEPITFPIPRVIEGWQEALQLMNEGDKWRIVVPPTLAYGETGSGSAIGPNATLVFDIELIEVKSDI